MLELFFHAIMAKQTQRWYMAILGNEKDFSVNSDVSFIS